MEQTNEMPYAPQIVEAFEAGTNAMILFPKGRTEDLKKYVLPPIFDAAQAAGFWLQWSYKLGAFKAQGLKDDEVPILYCVEDDKFEIHKMLGVEVGFLLVINPDEMNETDVDLMRCRLRQPPKPTMQSWDFPK